MDINGSESFVDGGNKENAIINSDQIILILNEILNDFENFDLNKINYYNELNIIITFIRSLLIFNIIDSKDVSKLSRKIKNIVDDYEGYYIEGNISFENLLKDNIIFFERITDKIKF